MTEPAAAPWPHILLASRSPRRRELLAQLGVPFDCVDVEVNEHWDGTTAPREFVRELALAKAQAGRAAARSERPVLGADTEVILDDRLMGKPRDAAHAAEMLGALSGRTHEVCSCVALIGRLEQVAVSISRVHFRVLTARECTDYAATGEPLGKAGAYAIQGRAAAFIARMEGSYSGVMGLPLYETAALLQQEAEAARVR